MNKQPSGIAGHSAAPADPWLTQLTPSAIQPDVVALLVAEAHHRAGRLAEAEAYYRRILDAAPENADVLYLLGVLAFQTDRREAAMELMDRAIEHNGNDPSYHCSLGLVLQSLEPFG